MTQDEIIQMAKQAGGKEIYSCVDPAKKTKGVMLDLAPLEAFANLVAAKEREACARLCEDVIIIKGGEVFAAKIRARGKKT